MARISAILDKDQNLVRLGKAIRAKRKERELTQEVLADHAEIDRSHMGFIEQGRRKPTLSTLFKIAKSLDMSLEQLFKGL